MGMTAIKSELVSNVYQLEKKRCQEIRKAMGWDCELPEGVVTDPNNKHWEKVEELESQKQAVLEVAREENELAAWYVEKIVELVPLISISKFLKILEVCGVEVVE